MKYRYEFEGDEYIVKGFCSDCPLSYVDYDGYGGHEICCVLHARYDECPLVEVTD